MRSIENPTRLLIEELFLPTTGIKNHHPYFLIRLASTTNKEARMNAPKQVTWIIALVIAAVAMIQEFNIFDLNLGQYTFYMMIISVAILALASKVKGM